MNGFDAVGMRGVSPDELEQTEGGFGFLLLLGAGFAGAAGYAAGSAIGDAINEHNSQVKLGSALANIGKAVAPK